MKYQHIINEWFAQLPKGYALPPYTQQEEQVLHQVLQKYNISRSQLIERVAEISPTDSSQSETQYIMDVDDVREPYRFFIPKSLGVNEDQELEPMSETDLERLKKKFESPELQEKYSKYLSVFYYFSPNSLGEVSEILLAKLLGGSHTGGEQGLEDLNVDGISISLKTTAHNKSINLGSYKNLTPSSETLGVISKLPAVKKQTTMTVSEIIKTYKGDPAYSIMISDIENRINAIAVKLAGEGDNEYFVWVEKVTDKNKVLRALNIYSRKFIKSDIITLLNICKIKVSSKGWSLVLDNGNTIVGADSPSGKYLNINPTFIRSKPDAVSIKILDSADLRGAEAAKDAAKSLDDRLLAGAASDSFFNLLDTIYDNFISKLKTQ